LRRLPWPAPALLAWVLAWFSQIGLTAANCPPWLAWVLAAGMGAMLAGAWPNLSGWRRGLMAGGFPVSAVASGAAAAVPAWAWLLPLLLLLAAYPLRAWRDAPLFPTPADALQGLAERLPLPAGARVLDVGSGLGHGLAALHRCWPQAHIEGIEWSWPLRLATAWRCPWARVRQGDMWAASWAGYSVVYCFQRPESMARAWQKARAELAPGAWLVSLDFEVTGVAAQHRLQRPGAQTVWVYRVPPVAAQHSTRTASGR
jgi:hypothetical protein